MAKIHFDYLARKYGTQNVTGLNYRTLMNEILYNQQKNIANRVNEIENKNWKSAFRKINTEMKQFVLPGLEDVLPKRSVFLNKSAEKGLLITDTLKDKLTKTVRETLQDYRSRMGKPAYVVRAGVRAGVINPKVIKNMEDNLYDVFKNYTKKNPQFGIPTNIHTIAVTETRITINTMKTEYMKKLKFKNKNLEIEKEWIHNANLVKQSRHSHKLLHKVRLPIDKMFEVKKYRKTGFGYEWTGQSEFMNAPHDVNASAEEVIGCQCDIKYYARKV